LFRVATAMFRELWDRRLTQGHEQAKALTTRLAKIDKEVSSFLTRIVESSVPSVITAYEDRVRRLEEEKHALKERLATSTRPATSFDGALRTAFAFLASPSNLWKTGRLEDRQTVLKLTFASRLRYHRGEGFRTADLALPFKVLNRNSGAKNQMAHPSGFEPLTFASGGQRSIH
jgi:site-specific DNA recombinase